MILHEDFQVHNTLNPLLWEDEKLKPEVKNKIIEIVSEFEDFVKYPMAIVDIQIVGSNAGYNYTNDSDLDVHIIADFDQVSDEEALLQALYDSKKSQFKKYDISIHGIDVELYVQDMMSGIYSNGIYSVCDDDWVKHPVPIENIKNYNLNKEISRWKEIIDEAINSGDIEKMHDIKNALYLMRKNSLAVDGNEYGKGNQLFKDIRSLGYIQKLKDAMIDVTSKNLTLEEYGDFDCSGSIVNRFDY